MAANKRKKRTIGLHFLHFKLSLNISICRFAKEEISHCFASPFDRTIETACAIMEGKGVLVNVSCFSLASVLHCFHAAGAGHIYNMTSVSINCEIIL